MVYILKLFFERNRYQVFIYIEATLTAVDSLRLLLQTSVSTHSKVAYISLTHAPISAIRRCLYFSLLSLRIQGAKTKPFLDGILRLHEYLTDGQPNCDQYRYLNIFVKKWRWVDKTPEDVQNLVNEVYGIDVSSDDFLKSILREISYSLD